MRTNVGREISSSGPMLRHAYAFARATAECRLPWPATVFAYAPAEYCSRKVTLGRFYRCSQECFNKSARATNFYTIDLPRAVGLHKYQIRI